MCIMWQPYAEWFSVLCKKTVRRFLCLILLDSGNWFLNLELETCFNSSDIQYPFSSPRLRWIFSHAAPLPYLFFPFLFSRGEEERKVCCVLRLVKWLCRFHNADLDPDTGSANVPSLVFLCVWQAGSLNEYKQQGWLARRGHLFSIIMNRASLLDMQWTFF